MGSTENGEEEDDISANRSHDSVKIQEPLKCQEIACGLCFLELFLIYWLS